MNPVTSNEKPIFKTIPNKPNLQRIPRKDSENIVEKRKWLCWGLVENFVIGIFLTTSVSHSYALFSFVLTLSQTSPGFYVSAVQAF